MSRKNLIVVVLGCLVLSAAGCGGSKGQAETVDKFPEAKQRLLGQWQGLIRVADKEKAIKEYGKDVYSALQSMRMVVTFTDDGKMSTKANVVASQHTAQREGTATWEVIKHEGDKIEIRSVDDKTKREENVAITFSNHSQFTIPYKEIGYVELRKVVKTARK